MGSRLSLKIQRKISTTGIECNHLWLIIYQFSCCNFCIAALDNGLSHVPTNQQQPKGLQIIPATFSSLPFQTLHTNPFILQNQPCLFQYIFGLILNNSTDKTHVNLISHPSGSATGYLKIQLYMSSMIHKGWQTFPTAFLASLSAALPACRFAVRSSTCRRFPFKALFLRARGVSKIRLFGFKTNHCFPKQI